MSDAFLIVAPFNLDEHRNRLIKLKTFVELNNRVYNVDTLSFLSSATCIRWLLSIQDENLIYIKHEK
ncbi:hypothetical protein QLX08_009126 [Tetragonisca angustula]|uniref:Uncharacterized protein n=1 Tax=Tetragonisca angustula TaxID=166442 RepID=A0AAW0ZJ66_9HYME